MATVLGIVSPTSPFMHDNSASIVRDGRILASIQEERMSGVKHDTNIPINSIKECFRLTGLTGKDIDAIVCATEAFTQRRFTFDVNRFGKVVMSKATSPISFALKHFYMRKLKEWFGIRGKIMYMNHHLAHAASAFYTSGYSSAAVVTLDGLGDHESGSIYAAAGTDMKRLWSQPEQKSLGLFYGMVSESLGFTQQDGEGKCVHPDTPVILSDGSVLKMEELFEMEGWIKNINENEQIKLLERPVYVYSLNKETLKIETKEVGEVFRQKINGKLMKVKTETGRWALVTPVHKLIIRSGSLLMEKKAKYLSAGESLVVPNGEGIFWEEITEAREVGYKGYVYDIVVPDNHNFVGGFGPMILHNTMGFACYGKPHAAEHVAKFYDRNEMEPAILRDISTTDGKLFAAYRYVKTKQSQQFKESFKHFKPEDIAASAQKVLEDKGLEIVKDAMNRTGETRIAVAGGVFLNCKLNQRIRELPGVESLFIHPAAGDNGVCTGTAIEACRILDPNNFRPEKMEHVYYGSGYTNEEIEKNIKDYNLSYERLKDPAGTAADLIKKGKVVGWFQGRMEYGPRALGNRSVLADPTDPKMRDRINQFLKKRDWFMPFCPSMLIEAKDEYLVNPAEAPFMITTFDVPKNKAKEIPAVVHVDNTARPQTVKKEVNPLYWRLIKQFEKYKVPMVLNTSFNKHGLPMIRTPQDALNHLVWKCVDVLIMDDFLIERKFA